MEANPIHSLNQPFLGSVKWPWETRCTSTVRTQGQVFDDCRLLFETMFLGGYIDFSQVAA